MTHVSRRTLLLGGGALLASTAAGAAVLGRDDSLALVPRPSPVPTRVATTTPPSNPAPLPTQTTDVPALGTSPVSQFGEPPRLTSIARLAIPGVMQDVVFLPSAGVYFVTQKLSGSNGSELPYESTVVNRVRAADGVLLDAMTLIDGGHGLGFEAEADPDGATTWIWMTWHGASADSEGREQDFVRLRYTPGTWSRGQANQQLGLTLVPFQDRTPEAVYHFDWSRDLAVERHFNPPQAQEAPTETFVLRRLSDVRAGTDHPLAEILLRATPPTTQGFTTVNGTLFRWLGSGASNGAPNPSDPITLEQYSWATGQLVGTGSYPSIWQPWDDGTCEPQGLSVHREADGSASLILGLTTGGVGNHRYQLSKLTSIGTA